MKCTAQVYASGVDRRPPFNLVDSGQAYDILGPTGEYSGRTFRTRGSEKMCHEVGSVVGQLVRSPSQYSGASTPLPPLQVSRYPVGKAEANVFPGLQSQIARPKVATAHDPPNSRKCVTRDQSWAPRSDRRLSLLFKPPQLTPSIAFTSPNISPPNPLSF
jgi:hypothetical protein